MPLIPALQTDLPEVLRLVNGAYRGGEGARGWTDEADFVDGLRTTLEALQADLETCPGALLILRDAAEGELCGCVRLESAAAGTWHLGMLSVRTDRQDSGLGRMILEAAELLAREGGARRISMRVVNIRDSLIAWYGRRGYAPTGETQPFPYHDQRFGRPRRDDLCFVVLEKAL